MVDLSLTLLLFSIRARSQTETSLANLVNSRTCVSNSEVHLLTISSIVLPLSIDGGGTEIATEVTAGCAFDNDHERKMLAWLGHRGDDMDVPTPNGVVEVVASLGLSGCGGGQKRVVRLGKEVNASPAVAAGTSSLGAVTGVVPKRLGVEATEEVGE